MALPPYLTTMVSPSRLCTCLAILRAASTKASSPEDVVVSCNFVLVVVEVGATTKPLGLGTTKKAVEQRHACDAIKVDRIFMVLLRIVSLVEIKDDTPNDEWLMNGLGSDLLV